tara:strand:+ start:3965 stop:4180 length:216 start_codon:yes stop_codon:yes gene_type:complete
MAATLRKHRLVDEVTGSTGDYFVWLVKGWTLDPVASACNDGCHCFGADTVKEALEMIGMAKPCIGTCCTAQ